MEPNGATNGFTRSSSTLVKVLAVVLGAVLTITVLAVSHEHYKEVRLSKVLRVSRLQDSQQQPAKQVGSLLGALLYGATPVPHQSHPRPCNTLQYPYWHTALCTAVYTF